VTEELIHKQDIGDMLLQSSELDRVGTVLDKKTVIVDVVIVT
jgi:hypothetical protein